MRHCRHVAACIGLAFCQLTTPHRVVAQAPPPSTTQQQGCIGLNAGTSSDKETHKGLLGFESDIPLTVTTFALVVGTGCLAWANFRLYSITKDHVRHITQLADTVKEIQASNTLALIQASLIQERQVPPTLLFKNVGRVSARLTSATLKTVKASGAETTHDLPYYKDLWLSPSESSVIQQHPAIANIWADSIRHIALDWVFDDGLKPQPHQSARWDCDHAKHLISRGA
jgi:hypothetical protein